MDLRKMEKTISVQDFLKQLDADLNKRKLHAVRDALSELAKADLERPSIKKRVATYYFYNGELKRAISCFRRLIDVEPASADNYVNLMKLLQANGQEEEAFKLAGRLTKQFKERKDVNLEVGKLFFQQEKYSVLQTHAEHLLALNENDVDYLLLRGDSLHHARIKDIGMADFEKGLLLARSSRPELITAILISLIQIYYKNSLDKLLISTLAEVHLREDRTLAQNKILIEHYEKIGALEKSKIIIDECEKKFPSNVEVQIYKAVYYRRMGDMKNLGKQLDGIQINDKTPLQFQIKLNAEIAKYQESLKHYSTAFSYYEKMNAGTIAQQGGSLKTHKTAQNKVNKLKMWDELITPLSQQYNSQRPYQDNHKPIFFVGFPRSGTTLVDQILSSHPDIQVIEEKPILTSVVDVIAKNHGVYPSLKLAVMQEDEKEKYRRRYFELLNYFSGSSQDIIVNKLPLNIVHVPLILTLFPNAKIIVALRHPMDCALSCFFQTFGYNAAMANFLTMEDTVNYYAKVMGFYLKVKNAYNVNIHAVRYEDLVNNLEKEVRSLLDYLEIHWDDSVAKFYETARNKTIINTPSYTQVTQPIYTSSSYKWKHYESEVKAYLPKLQQCIDAFGYSE